MMNGEEVTCSQSSEVGMMVKGQKIVFDCLVVDLLSVFQLLFGKSGSFNFVLFELPRHCPEIAVP